MCAHGSRFDCSLSSLSLMDTGRLLPSVEEEKTGREVGMKPGEPVVLGGSGVVVGEGGGGGAVTMGLRVGMNGWWP